VPGTDESGSKVTRAIRLAATLATVIAVPAIASCGGDDDTTTTTAPRTVAAEDVGAFERGSPERAVLEWWRYVQFRNAEGAHALYSDEADVTLDDLSRQVTYAASSFVGVPEIVDVEQGDGLATVYMVLQAPGSDAPPRPLSANLREEGGTWVLRDNVLMEQQAARVARARAAAEGD
jgi:hypothetical protein